MPAGYAMPAAQAIEGYTMPHERAGVARTAYSPPQASVHPDYYQGQPEATYMEAQPGYYQPQVSAMPQGAPQLFQPMPPLGAAPPAISIPGMAPLQTVPSMVSYPFQFSAMPMNDSADGADGSTGGTTTDGTSKKDSSSKKLTAKKKGKGCC
mmetsp:Transcript_2669/g.5309  ORF Transcript_2669/g.5309 Transcript_2669/m.5309 type:complete len:152 (-) Transcript_2669:156-611(-)